MGKITFMGAGSTVFAKNVLGDSLQTDSRNMCEFFLIVVVILIHMCYNTENKGSDNFRVGALIWRNS